MIYVEDAAEIFVRAILSDSLRHPVYISGGHLATLGEMADMVRDFIPNAQITTRHPPRPPRLHGRQQPHARRHRLRDAPPPRPRPRPHQRSPHRARLGNSTPQVAPKVAASRWSGASSLFPRGRPQPRPIGKSTSPPEHPPDPLKSRKPQRN